MRIESVEGKSSTSPNQGLQATADSFRSYVAPAIGGA